MNQEKNFTDKTINFDFLNQCFENDKTSIASLLDLFLQEFSKNLELLDTAVSIKDFKSVDKISHKMISSTSVLGIDSLKQLLREINSLSIEANQIEKINALFIQVKEIGKRALEEVKKERQLIQL